MLYQFTYFIWFLFRLLRGLLFYGSYGGPYRIRMALVQFPVIFYMHWTVQPLSYHLPHSCAVLSQILIRFFYKFQIPYNFLILHWIRENESDSQIC